MAACGGLEHIFVPESPTLVESLSPWKQIKSIKTVERSSFTEIFGRLHFKESHIHDHPNVSSPSSYSSSNSMFSKPDEIPKDDENESSSIDHEEKNGSPTSSYCQKKQYRHSDSFSSMNSESLSLCTEGLGFESFDDVEDLLRNDNCNNDWQGQEERTAARNTAAENENIHWGESKRSRTSIGEFPPPISCIGRSGKPWVCFKSFREDGRFILKEIRIPTQELLHACRENGRLRLQFIQSDEEILEGEEEEEEDDEEHINEEDNIDKGKNDDVFGQEGEEIA